MHITSILLLFVITFSIGCSSKGAKYNAPPAPALPVLLSQPYPDPERYESAIEAFEAEGPPPPGAVMAIGSSSMRGWHKSIDEDLAPLTIVKRGFGGSNMMDVVHYTHRIVLPTEPRAILLYQGDNDIAAGVSPDGVLQAFRGFRRFVQADQPDVRIYIISIKPSPSRWNVWPEMQEANALLKAEAETDPRLFYIDIATPMLGENGEPLPDIFLNDNLHMNRKGYEIWRDAVAPVLVENEKRYE